MSAPLALSASEARALETLFDHQMWAFGRDVTRPAGNLFVLRGLRRVAAPLGALVSSTWVHQEEGAQVSLSSRGVAYAGGGERLLLERGPLQPQLRGAPLHLVPALAAWVRRYERWVHEVAPGWRESSLAARQRPSRYDAARLEAAWAQWAARPAAALSGPSAGGPRASEVLGAP